MPTMLTVRSSRRELATVTGAPIDLAQPLLAVDVVAVLRAVAVACGPRDGRHDFRTLLVHELPELRLQASEAARRHVIPRPGRQGRGRFELVVELVVLFARESLVHLRFDNARRRALHARASALD